MCNKKNNIEQILYPWLDMMCSWAGSLQVPVVK